MSSSSISVGFGFARVEVSTLLRMAEDYRREIRYYCGDFVHLLQPIVEGVDSLVGFCAPRYRGSYFCLGHLYIVPEFRGRGLASRVLREFCKLHERVEWWSRYDDSRSQHIAEKYLTYVEDSGIFRVYRK
jgi:GNAT superfamily N-acetyltransferase